MLQPIGNTELVLTPVSQQQTHCDAKEQSSLHDCTGLKYIPTKLKYKKSLVLQILLSTFLSSYDWK